MFKLYNSANTPNPQGFTNYGNSCYFNSILQCLLSCSSLNESLPAADNIRTVEDVAIASYKNIYEGIDRLQILNESLIVFNNSKKYNVKMSVGAQEDSHETLLMFLDLLSTHKDIEKLFKYKQRISILCNNCHTNKTVGKEYNNVFEIHISELATTSLQDYIHSTESNLIDYKCETCNAINTCKKNIKTTLLPEIITVLFKKYNHIFTQTYPEILQFPGRDNTVLRYQLVATSNHMGNHYWANCLRKGQWYLLNDASVSKANVPLNDNSAYLLFYSMM